MKASQLQEGDVIFWNKAEYIVIDVKESGGGYGHGQHDYYPSGLKISLSKLDNGKYNRLQESEFRYAEGTGCFTKENYLGKFKLLRKMQRDYV